MHRIYFSGDTGYSTLFKEIGDRLGPFDITFIESGAYHKAWPDVHLGPEQAIRVHLDVRGNILVPVHWGTFDLGSHAWTEPVERLITEAKKHSVKLAIPRPGESIDTQLPATFVKWWPDQPSKTAEEDPIISSGGF